MPKLLIFVFLLTIAVIRAPAVGPLAAQDDGQTPSPTPPPRSTTYTTSDGSFTFAYPEGWVRAGDSAGNVILAPTQTMLNKAGNALLPGEFQIEVLAPAVARQLTRIDIGVDAETFMQDWLAQLPPELEVLFAPEALAAGERVAVQAGAVIEPLDWLMVAVELGEGHVALIFGFAPRGELSNVQSVVAPLAASMQFTPPQIDRAALSPLSVGNATSAENLALWTGHNAGVRNVDVSADGTLVVSADERSVVLLRDTATGTILSRYVADVPIIAGPHFVPNTQRVVLGSIAGDVYIVDMETGTVVQTLAPMSDVVWDVTVSADGRYVAAVGRDLTARVWALAGNGEPTAILTGHRADVVGVAFTSNHEQLVTSSLDGTVRIWNIASGNQLLSLLGPTSGISSVAINRNDTLLVGGAVDGAVVVWDIATQDVRWRAEGEDGGAAPVTRVAFAPDGALVAAAAEDGSVRLWEAANGVPVTAFGGPSLMNDVVFSNDGRLLVGANQAGVLLAWGVR